MNVDLPTAASPAKTILKVRSAAPVASISARRSDPSFSFSLPFQIRGNRIIHNNYSNEYSNEEQCHLLTCKWLFIFNSLWRDEGPLKSDNRNSPNSSNSLKWNEFGPLSKSAGQTLCEKIDFWQFDLLLRRFCMQCKGHFTFTKYFRHFQDILVSFWRHFSVI